MGKRKRPTIPRTLTATSASPPSSLPAQPPSLNISKPTQPRKAALAPSSSSEDGDDLLLSLKPSTPSHRHPPSTSAGFTSSPPSTAGTEDDSDDEFGVHIIERPSGYTSPSSPSSSSSNSSESSESDDGSGTESDSEGGAGEAEVLHINRAFADKFEAEKRQREMSKKAQRGKRKSELRTLMEEHNKRTEDTLPSQEKERKRKEIGGPPPNGEEDEEGEEEEEESSEDDEGYLLTEALDVQIHQTLNAIKRRDPLVYDPSTRFFTEEDSLALNRPSQTPQSKKITVKDLVLQSLIAEPSDSEDEGERGKDAEGIEGQKRLGVRQRVITLTHVEEQAKLKADLLAATPSTPNDEDEDDDDDLFKVRATSPAQPPTSTSSSFTSFAASDAPLPPSEFLAQYLSYQWWKAPAASLPSYEAIKGEAPPPHLHSDDDADIDKGEEFEANFNFRYQEEGGTQVRTWPREVPESLRKVDSRRKMERERRKERKAEERRRRDEEVKKAKADHIKALQARVQQIHEVGGVEKGKEEVDLRLDGEFNEEDHQRLMASLFSEDYYTQTQVDDEETIAQLLREEEEDEEGGERESGKERVGRKPLAFAHPSIRQLQRGMEDVYALDYEDIIGGDLPTRFHYRKVKADTYGMTLEDLLMKEERELNARVSLKKMAPYREEGGEEEGKGMKGRDGKKRSRNQQRGLRRAAQAESLSSQDSGKGREVKGKDKRQEKRIGKTEKVNMRGNDGVVPPSNAPVAGEETGNQRKPSSAQRRRMREKKKKTPLALSGEESHSSPPTVDDSKRMKLL